jgi:hypothetical protein
MVEIGVLWQKRGGNFQKYAGKGVQKRARFNA